MRKKLQKSLTVERLTMKKVLTTNPMMVNILKTWQFVDHEIDLIVHNDVLGMNFQFSGGWNDANNVPETLEEFLAPPNLGSIFQQKK